MDKKNLRLPVLIIPSAIFIVVIALGLVFGDSFINALTIGFEEMMLSVGWLVSLTMCAFIIFMLVIIFGPMGKIRLGGPNAKPKMSYWQWFSVALCAGIGTGVVFWGAVEPILFTMEPAPSLHLTAGSDEAVIWAMRTSYMHWTLTPYAIYVTFGVILAYVCYNMKRSFNVSSGLAPLLNGRMPGKKLAALVDILMVFALVGGAAGSLGYGILQLSAGLNIISGIEPSTLIYVIICSVIVIAYLGTSASGLKKGIAWLGDKNATIYILLLLFFLIFGPTRYILNLATQSAGSFISNFIEGMTYTAPFADGGNWPQWWDQYWWVDWLSYGGIMGLFLVRLGYGRTLKEFVLVNWLAPSIFGLIWFSIFGGTGLYAQLFGGTDYYALYLEQGAEVMTLAVFDEVPLAFILKPVMLVVIAVSFITLANSMVSTISSITLKNSNASEEAPFAIKLFWGLVLGGASLIFVILGGIDGVKMVKTYAGIPILFVGIFMLAGFLRYMSKRPRNDRGEYLYEDEIADAPDSGEEPMPPSKLSVKWAKFWESRNKD